MQIDEEEDDAALAIILDAIDDRLGSHIVELHKGGVVLDAVGLDGFVDLFVVTDALAKVAHSRLRINIGIVGTA